MITGAPILTEHAKKYSLLNLLPTPIEKVVEDHVYSKSYTELKAYVLDNMGRWEKIMGSSGLNALDSNVPPPPPPVEIEGDDGELFTLARKPNG